MAVESPREFGEEIRRERELRDVTREQLALVTKVSVRQIEALETGRFEILPALVFSRGFVRSIALHLGLDAERTVAAFRHVWENWNASRERENSAPFGPLPVTQERPTAAPRRTVASSTTIRVVTVAATLAVVTAVAVLMKSPPPEARRRPPSAAPARPETGPASLALPPAVAAATVALPAGLPAASQTAAASPGGSGTSTLTLAFRDDCWTEVLVDGKVVVRALFTKGTTREFAGGRTFTLTLGNAGVVEVRVDGRSLQPIGGPGEVVKNYVIGSPAVRSDG
jgi:cytoskeleton protein RodZ